MGDYPPQGLGHGGVPGPGGETTNGEAHTLEARRKVGLHLDGGGESGGRFSDNGDLHLEKAKYSRTVYCDVIDSGPMQGGGEEEGGTGVDAMVETGGN